MNRFQIGLIAFVGLLAMPALAQSDFGGSFDDPGTGQVAPPPPAGGTAPAGDFGGSFGDGGLPVDTGGGLTPPPPPPPAPPPPPPPPGVGTVPGGGDFGDGGSFDPGTGGGTVTPIAPVVQPPAPPAPPAPPPQPQAGPALDPQIAVFEMRDFGVPPTQQLRNGQFHAPTPTAVPGAQTVTTEALVGAMQGGMQLVLIDVLGGNYSLPDSYMAPELASPGSFQDRTQQRAGQWLGQITGGNMTAPIVIYCSGPECWLSYNAVLRTVAAGYTNVYWYRGGLDAWQMAGLQLTPATF